MGFFSLHGATERKTFNMMLSAANNGAWVVCDCLQCRSLCVSRVILSFRRSQQQQVQHIYIYKCVCVCAGVTLTSVYSARGNERPR